MPRTEPHLIILGRKLRVIERTGGQAATVSPHLANHPHTRVLADAWCGWQVQAMRNPLLWQPAGVLPPSKINGALTWPPFQSSTNSPNSRRLSSLLSSLKYWAAGSGRQHGACCEARTRYVAQSRSPPAPIVPPSPPALPPRMWVAAHLRHGAAADLAAGLSQPGGELGRLQKVVICADISDTRRLRPRRPRR